MRNLIGALVLLSASTLHVRSDSDCILKKMIAQSDEVVHVKIMEVDGGYFGSGFGTDWDARCQVLTPYKGGLKVEQPFRLSFVRRGYPIKKEAAAVGEIPEPLKVEANREYILFLRTSTNRIGRADEPEYAYKLTDRSLGSQQYEKNLEHLVEFYCKRENFESE